ncbi:hypothetical protein KI688_009625 [Linnemannia hyalina]|uniref:O-fucosyltransferase family protein n=1 Tax=Linnemannia hyalina TaxID=64524 RepID=A0A9P7Y1U6_9FUNG|nr:hypothetical protein KI688_009625 [Linnemannia hyalina]
MLILAYRRRLWILLVPIINFIFLFLFVFSPSSLPRLPRQLSLLSKESIQQQRQASERVVEDLPPGTFEHITFQHKDGSPSSSLQFNGPANGSDDGGDNVGGGDGGGGVPDEGAGASAEGVAGYIYLLEQRKLVEGVRLTPLPQHLITTYRPGYLLFHSRDNQGLKGNSTDVKGPTSATEGGAVDPSRYHDSQAIFPHHPPNQGVSQQQQQQIQELTKTGMEESTTLYDKEEEEEKRINQDPTTKYITFLPHSGFHNQRTELENALLLARLLNRTLIMPKVYLGPPMPWLKFNLLHSRLLYQTKIGLEHCRAIIESQVEFDEDEEDVGLDGDLEGREVGGKEEQGKGRDHPQVSLLPQQKDAVHQEVPSVPVQEPKEVTPNLAGTIAKPEIKDDIHAGRGGGGGAVVSEELAATLDGQQVVPAVISADKEEAANSSLDSESMDQMMSETAEADVEMGDAEEEAEEEEEEGFQSWIEEPDEEDQDRVRIATGDGDLGNIIDLEDEQEGVEEGEGVEEEEEGAEGFDQIKDWGQTVGDEEDDEVGNSDFQTEQRRQRDRQAGGYDYERDPPSFQLGILDDDEDDEGVDDQDDDFDWKPEYYTLRQQQQKHRYRDSRQKQRQRFHGDPEGGGSGRLLSQQMEMDVEGAALPLYLPAPERPIDRKAAAGLQIKKRSMPTESPPLDPSRLEKRKLAGQYAFQQQQQHEPIPPEQQQRHRRPSTAASATAAKKKRPSRPMQWIPLPAECLQYESWTMTDWDLFFDLDPLRHYVRILTRESMSMDYLEGRFNITFLHPEEPVVAPAADTVPVESQDKNNASEPKPSTADGDAESDGDEVDKEGDDDSIGQEAADEGDATEDTEGDTGDDSKKPKSPLFRSEADVLLFDDTSLYDYRFSESPNATESLKTRSKFVQEFTIDWLAQRPERLIHLGSIFGTGRVAIESLEAMAWLQMIRDHHIIRTEILQTTSQRIADKISERAEEDIGRSSGGVGEVGHPMEGGFVGIHIRMSDGHFSLTARDTIENIRQELMWQIEMSDPTIVASAADTMGYAADGGNGGSTPPRAKKQGRLSIEQCRARASNHRRALQEQLLQQQQDRERERELGHPPMESPPSSDQEQQQQPFMQIPTTDSDPTSQPKRRSNGRYTPIYLATDAHRPRSNPIFDRLFSTFDCIFTLDDFSEDLEQLTQYRNPEDGVLMTKFLIPMVDAMVVAKAAAFFGTPASTFSNYIQRQLRPAYTGLYD